VDKKVEKLLVDECKKCGYGIWENDDELLELLRDYKVIYKEEISQHRWWNTFWYVIKIKDTYIGYVYAETTGDMGASEAGYDFDPDSICEMKPIPKTIITYIKK